MRIVNNSIWLCVVLVLWISVSVQAGEVQKTEEKTFPMQAGGSVTVQADEGDITIQSWEKSEILVKITKRAWSRRRLEAEKILDKIQVEMLLDGNRLVICEPEQQRNEDSNFFDFLENGRFGQERGYSVDYDLTIPRGVDIRAEADEGDITVSGTSGGLVLNTDEGDVKVDDVDILSGKIETDEGDVRVRGVRSKGQEAIVIETDEGDIGVTDGNIDELDASADEGRIGLENVRAQKLQLSADEGDVRADFTPRTDGSYVIETDEGSVRLTVPADASLEVDLETENGRADSDFDLSRGETDSGDRIEGRLRDGNAKLQVYAGDGDVVLRKRISR
jgi:DUF4097 and DUF4098 domain-containing protein YvlB